MFQCIPSPRQAPCWQSVCVEGHEVGGQDHECRDVEMCEQHFGQRQSEFGGTENGFHDDDFPIPGINSQVSEVQAFDELAEMTEQLVHV